MGNRDFFGTTRAFALLASRQNPKKKAEKQIVQRQCVKNASYFSTSHISYAAGLYSFVAHIWPTAVWIRAKLNPSPWGVLLSLPFTFL